MARPTINNGPCSVDGCDKKAKARGWCSAHHEQWRKHGRIIVVKGHASPGEPQKFIEDVALKFTADECLIWPFGRISTGYGICGQKLAHRIVCERVNGPPPSNIHEAAHSCGKGHLGCCNPKHLRWATPIENANDRYIHGTQHRGERTHGSVLTESDVLKIYELKGKNQTEIARMFGVSSSAISAIQNGRNWGWLTSANDNRKESKAA